MGALSIDLHKKEREYECLSLSDKNVVKYLLLYRSKLDFSYGISNNINIYQSGDTTNFNQELIVLYSSLDNLIARLKLKEKDKKFLDLIFEGYEISDIISLHNYPHRTAYRTIDRIVDKIIEINELDWKRTISIRGLARNEESKGNENYEG